MNPQSSRMKLWISLWVTTQKLLYLLKRIQTSGVWMNRDFQSFRKSSVIFSFSVWFENAVSEECTRQFWKPLSAPAHTAREQRRGATVFQNKTGLNSSYFISLHLKRLALKASYCTIHLRLQHWYPDSIYLNKIFKSIKQAIPTQVSLKIWNFFIFARRLNRDSVSTLNSVLKPNIGS